MSPNAPVLALVLTSLGLSQLPEQDPPPWILHAIRGEKLAGSLRLGADGLLHFLAAGEEKTLALDDVQLLEHVAATVEAPDDRRARIWLRSGVQLPVSGLSGSNRRLSVGIPFASGPLTVDLPDIAALRLDTEPVTTDFEEQLGEPGESSDYIYLLNEGRTSRLSVTVKGFGSDSLNIELSGQQTQVPWERLYGVIFARDSGAAPDRQPNPRVRLVLGEGTELEGRLLSLAESAELRFDEGASLRIDAARIRAVHFATDKLAYLTDMEPVEQEQTPALDRVWPWLADESPAGDAIHLGGKTFARGLVLFPRTRLTYDLQGRYDLFEAIIGIEDRGVPKAHAVFRVFADDKLLFESEPFTLAKEPALLRIPIPKVQRLTLEADFGENLDFGDHCVFADARVIQG